MVVGYLRLLAETLLLFLLILKIYHVITSTRNLLQLLYNHNEDIVLLLLKSMYLQTLEGH